VAKILVVDDHPHIVRLLERELEAGGHEVMTAFTGEEALRKVREEPPALVVLDVMLPGKHGLQVLRELKADPATQEIVVVLLTARDHPSEVTQGLQLGADWYVAKPFRPGDIATLARRFLAGRPDPAAVPRKEAERLPVVEIDLLTMAAADAFDLAARGSVAEGCACLTAGLQRAAAARAAGKPWADELACRYREIRDHYAARYGSEARQAAPTCG
jgi:two-component system, OmpR family, alkaline phosphatase synthesis response regulator PhoP